MIDMPTLGKSKEKKSDLAKSLRPEVRVGLLKRAVQKQKD